MAAGDAMATSCHATCLSVGGCGVLLLGPPGSGKSGLALQLIDQPGSGLGEELLVSRLVGDDQVLLETRQGELVARPAPELAGRLEVRGLGIVRVPFVPEVTVSLAVTLTSANDIERLPDEASEQSEICGVEISCCRVDPAAPGAAARVRAAVCHFLSQRQSSR